MNCCVAGHTPSDSGLGGSVSISLSVPGPSQGLGAFSGTPNTPRCCCQSGHLVHSHRSHSRSQAKVCGLKKLWVLEISLAENKQTKNPLTCGTKKQGETCLWKKKKNPSN